MTLPALYIGHGAPPLLDDPVWGGELKTLRASLPEPKAILIISAHWESAPTMISAPHADLVYDFGGFAPRYYQETYKPPPALDLNARLRSHLPLVHEHTSRGLDHGAWVPLKLMYPEAQIPVTQLSLPTQDPEALLALGETLRPLRDEGVLIVGSGFLTHGLPFLKEFRIEAEAPGWSVDFDVWAQEALNRNDLDSLIDFKNKAPGMPYAHPTVEHLTPLFVALGAGTRSDATPATAIEGYWMGLSKRSFIIE